MHYPNPNTYRMWLGAGVNSALIQLAEKKNSEGMQDLSVSDYVEKMIEHWWKKEYPDTPVPFRTKRYDKDLDFVQSA